MEVSPTAGNPTVNSPQVNKPINPVVPADQAPSGQVSTPPSPNIVQSPKVDQPQSAPASQPQSAVSAITSEPKSSKFKLFLIISVILIVIIWGTVAYLYFQNQSL